MGLAIGHDGIRCIGPTPPTNRVQLAHLKARVELFIKNFNAYYSPSYLEELEPADDNDEDDAIETRDITPTQG